MTPEEAPPTSKQEKNKKVGINRHKDRERQVIERESSKLVMEREEGKRIKVIERETK